MAPPADQLAIGFRHFSPRMREPGWMRGTADFKADLRIRPFFLYGSMIIPHAIDERTTVPGDGAQVPDDGHYAP